jgi:hypothetical protein
MVIGTEIGFRVQGSGCGVRSRFRVRGSTRFGVQGSRTRCFPGQQARDGEIGDAGSDVGGDIGAVGPEPVRGPVERAEKSAGRDDRIDRTKRTAANAFGHQRADAALVAIAFRHDPRSEPARQRIDLEVRGAALDFVE